jgi:hypothetical protein
VSGGRIADLKRHQHRVVLHHHLELRVHPAEPLAVHAFNAAAARFVSVVLSSMYFFWFCVVLDLVELPAVVAVGSPVIWVGYLSQTVIQLLALPALGAYARLNQQMQDAQATNQGSTLTAIHGIVAAVHDLSEEQSTILRRLDHDSPPLSPPAM